MPKSVATFFHAAFLSPLFLAFLALIPPIVLLYLLKLRRTNVVIASTFLWRKSLEDLTANAPFQKLRKNLLLFLQILILVCIVGAAARPFFRAEGAAGNNLCVLIDRSASMQTREGSSTRLELAKSKVIDMINTMRGGDKMMVVTFAEKSDVLCELTDERVRLRQAVRDIAPSDTRTKIRDAVLVAHSMKLSVPDLRLVVVTDGRIGDLDEIGTRAFAPTFLQVGSSRRNAGIVAFNAREPQPGETERQCFVLVHNESADPLDSTVSLYYNDELASAAEFHADPGGDVQVLFSLKDIEAGVLRAELDHPDDLDVDNKAWLALRPPVKIRTLYVSKGDSTSGYFLKRVLLLDPRVELGASDPANYSDTGAYDLTIFDGCAPTNLPQGTILFVNALPPLPGLSTDSSTENPVITSVDAKHPMMRFLNFGNVSVQKAMKLALPEGAQSLASGPSGPLIADVSREGRQIVVVGFDVADSNWPLRLSFPLFVQNLLAWTPRGALAGDSAAVTGHPLSILASPDVQTATVRPPVGPEQSVALDPMRPVYFGATEKAGVYTIACGADVEQYAVNLLDKNESSVAPAETLAIGKAEIQGEKGQIQQNHELWRWFLVAALLVLVLEWWIFSRRAWIW